MPTSWSSAPPATTTSASRSRMPWSVTIAGSIPPLTSRRSSRSAMLSTICTWTQEWSDIPSRSECDLRHVPPGAHPLVRVDRLEEALELAVAARRRVHLCLGHRLRDRTGAHIWALCFHSASILSGDELGGFMTGCQLRGFGLFAGFPTADVVTVISLRLKELG